ALPLLPTTPFLLLAAWCFAHSSDRRLQWLLNNRLFGKYIRDYRAGNGIPRRVKWYALSLLWITIGLSAAFAAENPWVRLGLGAIAVGVTIHVLSFKRKTVKKERTLVVAAETVELAPLLEALEAEPGRVITTPRGEIVICFTGVGLVAATLAVTEFIKKHTPDRVIQAGIAGAYADSGLAVGEVVTVAEERLGDLGVFHTPTTFVPWKGSETLTCPYISAAWPLPRVAGNSVQAAGAPCVSHEGCAIETMEGYALFAAGRAAGVPFTQVRAVSNAVGAPRAEWNIGLAVEKLNDFLISIL
ncbi:MAG: DUF454 family protein, partial [Rikenellaceae bacterium]|nr:DUF454 family protein [Rikenellaceae bacterium]